MFHATLLKPYKETEQYGPNILRPIPKIEPGEEMEYKVEQIMNYRK